MAPGLIWLLGCQIPDFREDNIAAVIWYVGDRQSRHQEEKGSASNMLCEIKLRQYSNCWIDNSDLIFNLSHGL